MNLLICCFKSALDKIGRETDEQMFSKLEEPKETTIPTELLQPDGEEQPVSKMSKEEQLDILAERNARKKGYVG